MAPTRKINKGPKLQKPAKNLKHCSICGKISLYKYFNVQSCEDCRHFFRRCVLKQTEYFCSTGGNCDISKVKCRGCHLDKCLRLGMDPTFMQAKSQNEIIPIVEALEVRRQALLLMMNLKSASNIDNDNDSNLIALDGDNIGNEGRKRKALLKLKHNGHQQGIENSVLIPAMHKNIFNNLQQEADQIEYFTKIMNAHKRMALHCFDFPNGYLNKFGSLNGGIDEQWLLDGPENILSMAACYSPYPKNWSDPWIGTLYKEIIEFDCREQHPLAKKGHAVYELLAVGVLKAMPAFWQLQLEDRKILCHKLAHQLNNLTNAYYSLEMGELSVTGPRGLSLIGIVMNIYKAIPGLVKMAPKVFIHPNEALRRISMLSKEEFALLIAIMFSNSAISGLSAHAKQVLYAEQCRYSQLLLKHCQHSAGNGPKGAQRFGQCLQLIEATFQAVRNFELMNSLIKEFFDKN